MLLVIKYCIFNILLCEQANLFPSPHVAKKCKCVIKYNKINVTYVP